MDVKPEYWMPVEEQEEAFTTCGAAGPGFCLEPIYTALNRVTPGNTETLKPPPRNLSTRSRTFNRRIVPTGFMYKVYKAWVS